MREILLIVRAGRRGLHMFQKTLNIEGMLSTTAREVRGGKRRRREGGLCCSSAHDRRLGLRVRV